MNELSDPTSETRYNSILHIMCNPIIKHNQRIFTI